MSANGHPDIAVCVAFLMIILREQLRRFQNREVTLTPVSQMEVGCSRIWGLKPTTQTQVSGTPLKPALLATQPRAPAATPDHKTSTRHTEQ